MVTMSLNSHFIVLFKNLRDKLQVITLARKMCPAGTETFVRKYEDVVRLYGYFLIDLKHNTKKSLYKALQTDVLLPSNPVPKRPKDESAADVLAEFLMNLVNETSRLDKQMEQILKTT